MRISRTIVTEKISTLILETLIDDIYSRTTKSSTTNTILQYKKWKGVTEKCGTRVDHRLIGD